MGLDMYLMAEQRVKEGSEKFEAIQKSLSLEQLKNLADEDYGYSCYVSGWNIGHMTPEPAYAELIRLTGMTPHSHSPHFDVALDTDNGDYLVRACCAYWRKANAIHEWFVNNCQDGVDECQLSDPIHGEVLAGLVVRCKEVIETPLLAAQLLPTVSGFFFGSVDYDEYYVQDLKDTVDMLTNVMQSYPKPLVLRYQSSW